MNTSASQKPPSQPNRQLRKALSAAAPSVMACVAALGGLSAWTTLGYAGTPPDLAVTRARVLQPTGGTPETAAFFRISNRGTSSDDLLKVTSPTVSNGVALSRHRMTPQGAAYRDAADRLPVPGRGTLDMSPMSSDVTVPADQNWRTGDRIPFVLWFRHSAPVRVDAEVVRPGTAIG
ncbi:copper chaperone PCu(A)C [Streptomyces sp. NPDC046939]|uniref:copper chaperone PCu(A)C n=1 Tax=Streptomyces sp. NPDC046939 TaxID=3155376 RepID=UPI0033D0B70E